MMHDIYKKKYYFINKFDAKQINLQHKNTIIIYRNYSLKKFNEKEIIKKKNFCKKKGNKFLLSNNIKLSIKLDLDGAYIPSFNRNYNHLAYNYKKNFLIIGSAHNKREIIIKEKQRVQEIFLSSIFKKNKNFLGLNRFNLLSNLTKKKIIALGGINNSNLNKLYLVKCNGYAGISFFEQKKGP